MADFLRSWIMNITVIIIFIMFLDTIMPNNSMKRYINVIVGLLIIIVVIEPFVLVKDYSESFNAGFLEAEAFIENSSIGEESGKISKYQKQQALDIFENNLKRRIANLVEKSLDSSLNDITVNLELEGDVSKEDFGNIKSVKVYISKDDNKAIEVDKIKIEVNEGAMENKNVINKDKAEYNLNDSKISSNIKDEISKALGISGSIVSVEVLQK